MQEELYKKLLNRIRADLVVLDDKPEETPESTLKALWHLAAGEACSARVAVTRELPHLEPDQIEELQRSIERRLAGVPLAHITGRQNFMGLELMVSPSAMVPRKETELLAERACEIIGEIIAQRGSALVVDVCTGAGNLPLAYAARHPRARIHASDLCPHAITLARKNIALHHQQKRISLHHGDLVTPFLESRFLGKTDLLTCNPPYISSGKLGLMHPEISTFEPQMAFDGGTFGINILERLINDAARVLRPGGFVLFEVGQGQGKWFLRRVAQKGAYREITPVEDGNGDIRAICARLKVPCEEEASLSPAQQRR